jgi:hypothetical protein
MYMIYHDGRNSGKFENIQSFHGDDLSIQGRGFKKIRNAVVTILETLCLLRMITGNHVYVLDV